MRFDSARDTDFREIMKIFDSHAPQLPYHNLEHEKQVSDDFIKIALYNNSLVTRAKMRGEVLSAKDIELGILASRAHDADFRLGAYDNEERSAKLFTNTMSAFRYNEDSIYEGSSMILSTKMPVHPNTLLEKCLVDADQAYLATFQYWRLSNDFRREQHLFEHNDLDWYENQYSYLTNHRFFSEAGHRLLGSGLQRNIQMIRNIKDLIIKNPRIYADLAATDLAKIVTDKEIRSYRPDPHRA